MWWNERWRTALPGLGRAATTDEGSGGRGRRWRKKDSRNLFSEYILNVKLAFAYSRRNLTACTLHCGSSSMDMRDFHFLTSLKTNKQKNKQTKKKSPQTNLYNIKISLEMWLLGSDHGSIRNSQAQLHKSTRYLIPVQQLTQWVGSQGHLEEDLEV